MPTSTQPSSAVILNERQSLRGVWDIVRIEENLQDVCVLSTRIYKVTIVVVAVPEGLPLAVTLTLAYSMKKMMRDKALVRRLSSCETMGSATTICSDKTGTLTLNKMTVVESYFAGIKLDPCDDISQISDDSAALILEGVAQNTTGTVFLPEDGGDPELTGSPTEKAILSWGLKIGMDFLDTRSKSSVIHVFPFNSEKKRGAVAVESDEGVHVHWKGAAEIVLSSCKSWLSVDGSVQPMSAEKHDEYKKSIEDMAANSLRCVAFAYCAPDVEMVPKEDIANWKLHEDDLILLGIVGINVVTGYWLTTIILTLYNMRESSPVFKYLSVRQHSKKSGYSTRQSNFYPSSSL